MAELALDLDHEAITLLRRTGPDNEGGGEDRWEAVAEAPLDAPDLDARLRGLRAAAEALMGDGDGDGEGGPEADLLVPASQVSILDLDLTDAGVPAEAWRARDAEGRRALLARALGSLTGQDARGLAIDWRGEGPRLQIAAVAAETRAEAEEFARTYGFRPGRLLAWPHPEAGFLDAAVLRPAASTPDAVPEPVADRPPGRPAAAPATPRGDRPAEDEAEAMTVFGARRGQDGGRAGARRRAPRRLLLAGGLAAALALASAAALTLMPGGGEAELEAGEVLEGAEVAAAPDASPAPEPRPFGAEPVVVPVPPAGAPTPATAPSEDEAPGDEAPSEEVRLAVEAPAEVDPDGVDEADRARASYAATGIWRATPEAPTPPTPLADDAPAPPAPREEVTLAAAPSLAPPPGAAPDAPPAAMPPPPPPDARFELSADGRVEATPEGAPTPDGITVFAAAPPRRPPSRPPETVLPPGEAFQDPALADARPRPRPEDVAPVVAAATPEAAATDAATEPGDDTAATEPVEAAIGEALAEAAVGRVVEGVAPVLTLVPTAPGAPIASSGAALVDGAAVDRALAASLFRAPETMPEVTVAGTTIIEESTASAFAVAASQRPYARPGDLAPAPAPPAAASTAAGVTVRQVAAAPAPAPAPAAAPSAAPEIPTRASVARRATVENALRMNRLSLVGVFGAEGARRALVRLPSGRFEKVKVGDRIDGGRVRAIDDGRLIYARGGRNVALEMPRD